MMDSVALDKEGVVISVYSIEDRKLNMYHGMDWKDVLRSSRYMGGLIEEAVYNESSCLTQAMRDFILADDQLMNEYNVDISEPEEIQVQCQ